MHIYIYISINIDMYNCKICEYENHICEPLCKKIKVVESTVQLQSQIRTVHSIALVFYIRGPISPNRTI